MCTANAAIGVCPGRTAIVGFEYGPVSSTNKSCRGVIKIDASVIDSRQYRQTEGCPGAAAIQCSKRCVTIPNNKSFLVILKIRAV